MKCQVFLASDARGITMLLVSVYSLLRYAKSDSPLLFLIAHDDSFTKAHGQDKIFQILKQFPFATVEFRNFEPIYNEYSHTINTNKFRWPPMTWARVFLSKLFPEIDGTLLYLDIDTLVQQDLSELFALNFKGNQLFAAVPEYSIAERKLISNTDFPKSGNEYYNAGVLVINATSYRNEKICDQLLNWYCQNRDTAKFLDQDSINSVAGDRIIRLPLKWNYWDNLLRYVQNIDTTQSTWREIYSPQEALEAIIEPRILHYFGTHKPHLFNHRPERNRYRQTMIKLGLTKYFFPGENPYRFIEGKLFDLRYTYLRSIAWKKYHQL